MWFERRIRVLRLRLRSVFLRRELDQELDDELAYHVERLTERYVANGASPAEARRAALAAMDGLQQRKEECRDMRNLRFLDDLVQDARYACRQLRKDPAFTGAAVFVLALAIGGNTAMFSVARTVFTPLAIPDADRTVMIWTDNPARDWHQFPASMPDVRDWQASGVFSSVGAFKEDGFNLRLRDRTERVEGLRVTPGFFDTLSVAPALGRAFDAREADSDHVVMVSDHLWRTTLGGSRDVVGETVILDGTPYTIVGILPPQFPQLAHEELYALLPRLAAATDRGSRSLDVIGRLQHGLTLAAAQARMTEVSRALATQYPKEDGGMVATLQPLQQAYVQDAQLLLLLLLGAVGCALIVACANIASLLLARSLSRRRELAIRAALGGGRWRLTRQLLTEHLLLGFAAGIVSIAPAWWGVRLIASYQLEQLPNAGSAGLSAAVLAFNFSVALLTGVLCGVVPSWLAWKHDVNATLKGSPNVDAGTPQQRFRAVFVAGQLAATVVLLVAGGLMLRSFLGVLSKSPGYDAVNVLTLRVALSAEQYAAPERQLAFFDRVVERVGSLPGVLAASSTEELPTSDSLHGSGLLLFGQPEPRPEDVPIVLRTSVMPAYFATMRIPLRQGRYFTREDVRSSAPVAVIDEWTASHYWPGQNPIGQRFRNGRSQPWREIVGVVGDVEAPVLIRFLKGRLGQVYMPLAQQPTPSMSLVVRTAVDAHAVTAPIRGILRDIDPDQPGFRVRTLDEVRAGDRKALRVLTTTLSGFAAIALLLATVGLYGTVAYDVGQRTREFGLRLSLGAQGSTVMAMVLRRGARLLASGIGVGLLGAFASMQVVTSFLYGIQPRDPLTFAVAVLVLATSGMIATLLPARRAMKVDPIVALRGE